MATGLSGPRCVSYRVSGVRWDRVSSWRSEHCCMLCQNAAGRLKHTHGSMAKWLMLQCRFTQQSLFDAYHRCALISQLLEPDVACCLRLRLLRACRKYWLEAKESTKVTYRSCLQAWIRFIEWRRSLGHPDDFCVYPDTKASIQQRCVAALASKQPLTLAALLAGGAVPQVAPAGADSKQVEGPCWYCEEPPQRTAQVSSH
jgi:hypothetical protein